MNLYSQDRERISQKRAAELEALARMEGEGNVPQRQETHPMNSSIELCWECRTTCIDTLFGYCLEKGGMHAEASHVKLMFDCIEITQVAADLMRRHSEWHHVACMACAEICDACAESCEAMQDDMMDACAETCRRCAESCRSMAQIGGR